MVEGFRTEVSTDMVTQPVLNYRDTVILALGMFENKQTKNSLYQIYCRLYRRLEEKRLINFYLPSMDQFYQMIKKLEKTGLIEEEYGGEKYVLKLTNLGTGVYEVLINKFESDPQFIDIISIYRLYQQIAV